MKKLFVISLAVLGLVACEKRADYVILSGKIAGYFGGPVQIVGGGIQEELKINPDGTFVDTLKISPNYYSLVQQPNLMIPMYLEAGDVINIDIDNMGGFKISGRDSINSVYLQGKNKLTQELQTSFMDLFQKETEDFKKDITEIQKRYTDFLSTYKGLTKDFIASEQKSNEYLNLQLKATYPRGHKHTTGNEITMPQEFKNELDKLDYDNSVDFDKYYSYKNLVIDKFFEKHSPENPDWQGMISEIRALKSDNIKSFLVQYLGRGLSPMNTPETNKLIYDAIKEFAKDKQFLEQVDNVYQAIQYEASETSEASIPSGETTETEDEKK